ncbi:MAG: hypothetical protein B7Y15_04230 [Bacteroidetes bacterium 24-39-8]|nr:MAG: hypothetical protein B7Y15_04230 [Bacteroidetes bacterium 24-39-8]OZA66808.1 MAG: hypothetical protein B7X72_04995 [Sphingobacteriia bacterium 39-39-8]
MIQQKSLTSFLLFFFLLTGLLNATASVQADGTAMQGRWDLTIEKDGKQLPSWLEVQHSGTHTFIGRFVYAFGSARPVAEIKFTKNHFSFSIPPQWEPGNTNMEFEGEFEGDHLKGTMLYTDGKKYSFTGTKAPSLKREKAIQWGSPISLIGKSDMNEWIAMGANQWTVANGVLTSAKSGSNLMSKKTFEDFKLHLEFRYPKGSNSGVYLRGRYEVQIVDSKGMEPWNDEFSAVYGFLPANEMVAKDAGEWQTYDITLVGRMVTVVANGKTVISLATIPGITGGAIDSKEGEPGPLMIQGDHGPIEFRNIVITPSK